MSVDVFDGQVLSDKLAKLNSSQQSIEFRLALSRWCISHRKKARQVVETWNQYFTSSQREQRVTFLYLANDILQNSRRKGSEFVNEFWKVLPKELKIVYESGDEHAKKTVTRLVNIWEERKVFGSRAQNLKDEMLGKVSLPPVVSTGKSSNLIPNPISNPIKIVKRDANSLRIKVTVGCLPEKILTAFQYVLDEDQTEEAVLDKSSSAVSHLGKIREDIENTSLAGNQPGSLLVDELQVQENVLQECAGQLETAEKSHMMLISQLKEALKEQESKLDIIHSQLQVVRGHIEQSSSLRKRLTTAFVPGPSSTTTTLASDGARPHVSSSPGQPTTTTTSNPPPPQPTPLSQPAAAVSFAAPLQSPAAADDESKKAAAAAVVARLSASSSSAQMFTSVLSSLVAEELHGNSFQSAGFANVFPPEKRPRLEQSVSEADSNNSAAAFFSSLASTNQIQAATFGALQPPLPPPPPPPMSQTNTPVNQYMQQPGGMMATSLMPPYGYGGNGNFPPPPLPPPNFGLASMPWQPTSQQQLQPLEQPQQQQQTPTSNGGYYRPPGIGGFYGQMHQSTTPPVPRQ